MFSNLSFTFGINTVISAIKLVMQLQKQLTTRKDKNNGRQRRDQEKLFQSQCNFSDSNMKSYILL